MVRARIDIRFHTHRHVISYLYISSMRSEFDAQYKARRRRSMQEGKIRRGECVRGGKGKKIKIDFRSNRYFFAIPRTRLRGSVGHGRVRSVGRQRCAVPRGEVKKKKKGKKNPRWKRSQKPESRGFSAEATKILVGPSRRAALLSSVTTVDRAPPSTTPASTPPQAD